MPLQGDAEAKALMLQRMIIRGRTRSTMTSRRGAMVRERGDDA
ncbi:hypothetical protein CHELA20_54257 [Hyphomicrobiales bacterium]|nr:hypothetical protein CHELA20_54257 [Hyphomicrobiales bacterium]